MAKPQQQLADINKLYDLANREAANSLHIIGKAQRAASKHQHPCIIWFTGLPASGKSTTAEALEQVLYAEGYHTHLLDGDSMRDSLSRDLSFSAEDRRENIRRAGEVAKMLVDAGLIVLAAFVSPFHRDRQLIREMVGEHEFIEVFVDTPLAVCEQRDPKDLYRQARAGKIPNLTGIGDIYEAPGDAEIRINTQCDTPIKLAQHIAKRIKAMGVI